MIKKLLILLLVSHLSSLYAQTIKTDVLVIGGSPSGVAAAIQCAHSKVKTILAAENISLIHYFYVSKPGFGNSPDSSLKSEKLSGESTLKKITDTIKNLTVYLNTHFESIKKDGGRWEVKIMHNGKNIEVKATVVVDATENGSIAEGAGAKINKPFNPEGNNASNLYRTSIAAGEWWPGMQINKNARPAYPPYPNWYIPIKAVLAGAVDNLLLTEKILPPNGSIRDIHIRLDLGQGVGTVAAYCAFFKTTTQNLKVRIIQGELLDFKGCLLPFADIAQNDPDCRAIQQVGATGLLKGQKTLSGNITQFVFAPDAPVATAEIEPVLTEIYTRAFLWFRKEKPGEKFTIGNILSFISDYTLTDPVLLESGIQKAWKTQYKFKIDFDLNRQVTRREFAVLANKYLNPFARTVDLNGSFVN